MKRIRVDMIRETLQVDGHLTEEYTDQLVNKMKERTRAWNARARAPRKPQHGRKHRVSPR